jgi:AraC-like DNA-binding protein
MKLDAVMAPRFHIALHGDCVIGAGKDNTLVQLKHMDVVMLPHGNMHWIADHPGRELVPSEMAGEACELGQPMFQQGEITNKLICGIVHYEKAMLHPLLDALPEVMHFSGIESDDPIWTTILLIDAQMENTTVPRTTLVDRLTEVLFLQLLYRYVDQNPELPGFLFALSDRRIYRMLELIHREPEASWTLESLGNRIGMSRATVARQFHKIVGIPPLQYISNWRMMKTHHLAKYSTLSFDEIADQVGFSGARALSRAFLRKYGYTPSQLRKKQKGGST